MLLIHFSLKHSFLLLETYDRTTLCQCSCYSFENRRILHPSLTQLLKKAEKECINNSQASYVYKNTIARYKLCTSIKFVKFSLIHFSLKHNFVLLKTYDRTMLCQCSCYSSENHRILHPSLTQLLKKAEKECINNFAGKLCI